MSTPNARLAAVEQRLSAHEERCEERLAEIRAVSASTLKAVEGLRNRAWGATAALLAWALAQLWSANSERLGHLEAGGRQPVRTVAVAQRTAGGAR